MAACCRPRHWRNEYVTRTNIEYTTINPIFAKYQQGQSEPKEDTCLQMVPGSWKAYISMLLF